jgi:hypothetical protein
LYRQAHLQAKVFLFFFQISKPSPQIFLKQRGNFFFKHPFEEKEEERGGQEKSWGH